MEHETEAVDVHGFLDLLGGVMRDHDTGVLSVRIHVRDGVPWAMAIQIDQEGERAA
jgi:hypothetical protein